MSTSSSRAEVARLLRVAQTIGHLGPGDVEAHIDAAIAQAAVAGVGPGERWFDLGTGAGLPGLVIAALGEVGQMVLVERSAARCDFLMATCSELDLADKVVVLEADATEVAHDATWRATGVGVCCRLFASPGITAECAAGLLQLGGRLCVSEPPEGTGGRWDPDAMRELGFAPPVHHRGPPAFMVATMDRLADVAVPRRWPRLKKRPLF